MDLGNLASLSYFLPELLLAVGVLVADRRSTWWCATSDRSAISR